MFDWLTNTRNDLFKDLFIKQLAREKECFSATEYVPFSK